MIKLLFGRDGLKTNQSSEILHRINDLRSCDLQSTCESSARAARLTCSSALLLRSTGCLAKESRRKAEPSCSLLYLSPQVAERPRDVQLGSCALCSPAKRTALRAVPGFGAGACSLHWLLGIGGRKLLEGSFGRKLGRIFKQLALE